MKVDEKGTVGSAKAISGETNLQPAAVEAAKQAKFKPSLLNGHPVVFTGVIIYTFVLPATAAAASAQSVAPQLPTYEEFQAEFKHLRTNYEQLKPDYEKKFSGYLALEKKLCRKHLIRKLMCKRSASRSSS